MCSLLASIGYYTTAQAANLVDVTAIVDTACTFTISGTATSTVINGETTIGSTSPTLINYGVLTAGVPEVLGQRLNVTTNMGSTSVAYKIEITTLQEAADDYNTTLTYIATPTF